MVAAREGSVAFGDQNTLVRVADAFDIDAQTEAIEQLRPQLALLGIHGPDEDEARGVAERNAFALDDVDAHRGCVEEDVNQVVVEQVDLVDVEDVAVRLGQHAGLKAPGACAQRGFQVDRADDAILGCVDGQLDHPHAAPVVRQDTGRPQPAAAVGAQGFHVGRVAAEVAAFDDVVLRQQPGQRAHGGRLAGPLFPSDEHPADGRDDGVENQRELHRLLADDRGEGIGMAVEGHAHLDQE